MEKAEKRTTRMIWAGLFAMGVQFGFLARLTWFEYSWDIMEPVTYFVTYGTTMCIFAYYVLTRQVCHLQSTWVVFTFLFLLLVIHELLIHVQTDCKSK